MTTPHPALTLLEIAELEHELSKWGGEIPLRCGDVAALLAMATEHLRLVSALNHLREKGWYLWHKDPGLLDDESQGATVLDSVYSVAKQTGWTPETAESPELPKARELYEVAGSPTALAQALADAEQQGKEAAGQAWVDLLQDARHMLNATSDIYPGRSREEVEREAYQRLSAAVNAFPHPCAAAEPQSKPEGGT